MDANRKLRAACIGLSGFIFLAGMSSLARAQEDPPAEERRRATEEVQKQCATAKGAYEEAKENLRSSQVSGTQEQIARDRALHDQLKKDYCRCLLDAYLAAGVNLPPEYYRLCDPKPEPPPPPRTGPTRPTKPPQTGRQIGSDPCAKEWLDFQLAETAWVKAGRPLDFEPGSVSQQYADAKKALCECRTRHNGGKIPWEVEKLCKEPTETGVTGKKPKVGAPKGPILIEPGAGDSPARPEEDGENPPGKPRQRGGQAPGAPQGPFAAADCETQKQEWSRLVDEYQSAQPKTRQLYDRVLEAFKKYCDCLEKVDPAEFQRSCMGGIGVLPPDGGIVPPLVPPSPDSGLGSIIPEGATTVVFIPAKSQGHTANVGHTCVVAGVPQCWPIGPDGKLRVELTNAGGNLQAQLPQFPMFGTFDCQLNAGTVTGQATASAGGLEDINGKLNLQIFESTSGSASYTNGEKIKFGRNVTPTTLPGRATIDFSTVSPEAGKTLEFRYP